MKFTMDRTILLGARPNDQNPNCQYPILITGNSFSDNENQVPEYRTITCKNYKDIAKCKYVNAKVRAIAIRSFIVFKNKGDILYLKK